MSTDLLGPSLTAGGTTVRPGETRAFQALDTWMKDCTDPDADDGTQLQAALFNAIIAVLRGLARGNGNTLASTPIISDDNTNDNILLNAAQYLIQRGLTNYAADTGTADALVVALSPAMPEMKAGAAPIRVKKSNAANATTTPTIIVNGIGPATIVSVDGTALETGELPANSILELLPDGTNWRVVSPPQPATVAEAEAGALLHRFISPQTLLKRRVPFFVFQQAAGTVVMPANVNTVIPLTFDAGHFFSDGGSSLAAVNNRFVCGTKDAGLWMFIGTFGLDPGVSTQINCSVFKNGGTPTPYQGIQVQNTVSTHMAYALQLAANDYVQLSGFQNSGGNLNLSQGQLIGYRLSA